MLHCSGPTRCGMAAERDGKRGRMRADGGKGGMELDEKDSSERRQAVFVSLVGGPERIRGRHWAIGAHLERTQTRLNFEPKMGPRGQKNGYQYVYLGALGVSFSHTDRNGQVQTKWLAIECRIHLCPRYGIFRYFKTCYYIY